MRPGYLKNESLADRMKRYESVSDFILVPGIPVYIRLDQRAGHIFTENFKKPFDHVYMDAMYGATRRMVKETSPLVAYIQSDEVSLVYECPEKMPFEGRLFKIQSVFASMFTSMFILEGEDSERLEGDTRFRAAVYRNPPSFDCRVCQMPLVECANMILWRQRDCIKNSITMAALDEFSTKEIEGRNSEDKIAMLAERGIDYHSRYLEEERLGTFVRKMVVDKELTEDEISMIPPANLPQPDLFGKMYARRNIVRKVLLGRPLDEIANRREVLFEGEVPVYTISKDTKC